MNILSILSLDVVLTEELKTEGVLRELIRTINGMRKDVGLTIKDQIIITWFGEGEITRQVFTTAVFREELKRSVLAQEIMEADFDAKPVNINSEKVKLQIEKV